jgi:hypothetical protein
VNISRLIKKKKLLLTGNQVTDTMTMSRTAEEGPSEERKMLSSSLTGESLVLWGVRIIVEIVLTVWKRRQAKCQCLDAAKQTPAMAQSVS